MIFEVSRSEAHTTFHWGLNWIRQVLPASLYEEFGDDPELWSLIQEMALLIYGMSTRTLERFSGTWRDFFIL
jgi:hypothetical protein